MELGLGYVGQLFYLSLLESADPDMQGACFLFNWFFSLVMTFGIFASPSTEPIVATRAASASVMPGSGRTAPIGC